MNQQFPITSRIISLIEQKAGLLLRESHRAVDACRGIETTIMELGLRDENNLYSQLQQHDTQHLVWQTLLKSLTIGETYFFRNKAHFDALREDILPRMIARKREQNHRWLRIWSAGCATGEEIYSLAILIRELLPDYKDWSIYLIGTDINETYLEQAKQGVYKLNSFRNETPESLRDDWFTHHGNAYKLDASIRNMVIFQHLNLVTDLYPTPDAVLQGMDIILCQNVTIYFERPITERIQANLVETLGENGWLILGHSEPLFIKSNAVVLRNFPNAIVFQRQNAPIQQKESVVSKPPMPQTPQQARVKRTSPLHLVNEIKELDLGEAIFEQAQQAADGQAWDEALALLDKGLQSHPLHEFGHYLRGLIYIEKSEPQKALSSLRHAIYCNSNFILAHYTLGELYNQLGYSTQAMREWQLTQNLIASLDPESPIPHSPDLSAVMLKGLLIMQLGYGGMRA